MSTRTAKSFPRGERSFRGITAAKEMEVENGKWEMKMGSRHLGAGKQT